MKKSAMDISSNGLEYMITSMVCRSRHGKQHDAQGRYSHPIVTLPYFWRISDRTLPGCHTGKVYLFGSVSLTTPFVAPFHRPLLTHPIKIIIMEIDVSINSSSSSISFFSDTPSVTLSNNTHVQHTLPRSSSWRLMCKGQELSVRWQAATD